MAGGAAMADAFIQLGDLLHRNTNQSIGVIGGLRNQQKKWKFKRTSLTEPLMPKTDKMPFKTKWQKKPGKSAMTCWQISDIWQ